MAAPAAQNVQTNDLEASHEVDKELKEEAEIPIQHETDEEDPQPTPIPEEHLAHVQAKNENNEQQQGPKKFADIVKTVMIVRNWLLSKTDDDDTESNAGGTGSTRTKNSVANDPFLVKFSTAGTEAADQNDDQNVSTGKSIARKIKRLLLKPIDPTKDIYYYWTFVITVACLSNLILITARFAFDDLHREHRILWFTLDYIFDAAYIIDMIVLMKKGYLEQGLMVLVPKKLALNYIKSYAFVVDVISIFPTDVLYFAFKTEQPLIRINRVLRCRRVTDFSDRTETRTNFPNAFRISKMIITIFIIFHINACVFFELSKLYGLDSDEWVFSYSRIDIPMINCHHHDPNETLTDDMGIMYSSHNRDNETCRIIYYSEVARQYMLSFYWSALTLTAIGEQPKPVRNVQLVFVTVDIILGMLIFATIVGNVGSMISNMNAAEAEFFERLDGVKQFMLYRKCNKQLQKRVVKWFNYIWSQKQSLDEGAVLDQLPTKLKAELAIHVHMETLRRVRIFQDCEPGLLVEMVLKLRLQVFSPCDYICRKGDIGKEMYIVKRGSLNVVSDDGKTVFVTLKSGSVFGELSILNIPGNKTGNKRSANVRSVGYSDLFVLSKDDLWDALREYPDAKRLLLQKGREILRKDNLLDETVKAVDEVAVETVDQKLARLEKQLKSLEENFDGLYDDFALHSAQNKKRLTHVEHVFQENKKQIKKDCMKGVL